MSAPELDAGLLQADAEVVVREGAASVFSLELWQARSGGFTCDDAIEMVGFGRFQKRLLLITGALFSADAMQMMLVAFISPAARCAFKLSVAEEALIASIVFAGMFVGSYACGVAADKYGRRAVFLGSAACVSTFGILSAFAPYYDILLLTQVRFSTVQLLCSTAFLVSRAAAAVYGRLWYWWCACGILSLR